MSDGGTTYRIDADGNFGQKMDEFAAKQRQVSGNFDEQSGKLGGLTEGIAGMAMQWNIVEMAIGKATDALQEHARLQREGSQHVASSEDAAGQMAQIATSPEHLRSMLEAGRQFSVSAGVPMAEGLGTVNQMANAGMLDQSDLFAQLRRSRLIGEVSPLLAGIASVQTSAPDAETPEEVLAVAMAAASSSTQNLDPVLRYLPRVAQASTASQLGFSFPEVAGLTASQMSAAGGAETGSTNAMGLIRGLGLRAGISPGTPLVDAIQQVRDRNLSPSEMAAMFGDVGTAGFVNASSPAGLASLQTSIEAAEGVTDPAASLREKASLLAEASPQYGSQQRLRSMRSAADARLMDDSGPYMQREMMRETATSLFGAGAAPILTMAGEVELAGLRAMMPGTFMVSDQLGPLVEAIGKQTKALLGRRGQAPATVEEP